MSSITSAAGGRIWTPEAEEKRISQQSLPQRNTRPGSSILPLLLIVAGFIIGIIILIIGAQSPVTVVNKNRDVLIIGYNTFTQYKSLPEVQNWIPEALSLDENTVSSVNLDGTQDGTTGSVTLTNGDTIPFTLHNYDSTFTIEEK